MKILQRSMVVALWVMLGSCAPIVDNRGHSMEAEDFKQIITNQSTTDDVRAILGSPTTTSDFGGETWYYMTQRKETDGPFAPKIADHRVVAIRFDARQVVTEITEYDKTTGKPVQIVEKTTPAAGNELTFTKQLFGNFGRFGTPGRNIDPRGMGR